MSNTANVDGPSLAYLLRAVEAETIERCAKLCINLRHPDKSSETFDWIAATEACAAAIRALPQEGGER